MSRRNRVPAAERKATLQRYRKALASGLTPSAAGRLVGCDRLTLRRWIDAEAAPVTITPKKRACLRCSADFASDGPHNRICKACNGAIAALPRVWSA